MSILPNNIALLFSKQQRERAPMRRPHLPANTNIKAFTNLRRKRQSSFTPRTAHLDGGWDVPQFVRKNKLYKDVLLAAGAIGGFPQCASLRIYATSDELLCHRRLSANSIG